MVGDILRSIQRHHPAMTDLIRRFRGLAIAFVVLALSAGAVFAAAPRFSPAADTEPGIEQPDGDPAATDDADSPDEDGDEDGEDEEGTRSRADADAGEAADGPPATPTVRSCRRRPRPPSTRASTTAASGSRAWPSSTRR